MRRPAPNALIAFGVAALGIGLFATMDAIMKGLVLVVGAFTTMVWRNLLGIGIAGIFYFPTRCSRPTPAALKLHVIRGVLSAAMGFLFFWGIGRVPLAQAVALSFVAPLIALYLAAVLLKETIGPRTIAGSVLAFAGILLIFLGQAQADLGKDAMIGSVAVLASAVLYALNIILMRQQSLAAEPLEIAFYQSLVVTVALGMAIPLAGINLIALEHWPMVGLAAMLAIASMLLLSWAYARAEASYLSSTEYTAILWAALFGWLVFGESLVPLTLAGAGMIVGGCIIAAQRSADASPKQEAVVP